MKVIRGAVSRTRESSDWWQVQRRFLKSGDFSYVTCRPWLWPSSAWLESAEVSEGNRCLLSTLDGCFANRNPWPQTSSSANPQSRRGAQFSQRKRPIGSFWQAFSGKSHQLLGAQLLSSGCPDRRQERKVLRFCRNCLPKHPNTQIIAARGSIYVVASPHVWARPRNKEAGQCVGGSWFW